MDLDPHQIPSGMSKRRFSPRMERLRIPHIFYGWYIVAAGMGIHLLIGMSIYGMQVFFTTFSQTFGWSRAAMSGAFSLQRLEGSILSPIEGFLVDRFGPRIFMIAGVLIAGLGLVMLSFLQTLWMFYISLLVLALGTGLCMGIPRTWTIVQWFQRQRGRALGMLSSGGALIGPLLFIIVWLTETFGWRSALLIMAIATWLIGLPLAAMFRGRPQWYGYLPDGQNPDTITDNNPETIQTGGHRQGTEDPGWTVRQVLRSRSFWILALILGAQQMGTSALLVHQIPYFESIGFTKAQAASGVAWFTVLSVIGRLGGGWVMDYVTKRLVLAGLLASQTLALIILANITAYWQVIPFAFFFGLSFGGMMPGTPAILSDYFGTRIFGAVQGLIRTPTVLSGIAAPVLMGWAFDTHGSYEVGIYILASFAAAAIPVALLARPPER